MAVKYDRLIMAMGDDELEQFCRSWVERKSAYVEVKRYGNSGDKGRDVVGFLTPSRHDCAWDNYQCKQYRKRLDVGRGLLAIGKVLYWASQKEFTPPRKFYFVAPKGLNGNLLGLIDKPIELKKALIANWDKICAKKIVQGKTIPLMGDLLDLINGYACENVHALDVDDMLADAAAKPLLVEHYGDDPGKYPAASVPDTVQVEEFPYIGALVEAYGEREKKDFADHNAVFAHPVHGSDLRFHRERYFEADGFQKFYRDNTSPATIESFRKEVRHGVHEAWNAPAADTLARIAEVMKHAAQITPAGPLARYAYISVKQGVCHHFVNDGELKWKTHK